MNSNKDTQLTRLFKIIRELCEEIHMVKSAQLDAMEFAKAIHENEQFKHKRVLSKAVVAIMIANKNTKFPKSIKHILEQLQIKAKKMRKFYWMVSKVIASKQNKALTPKAGIGFISSKFNFNIQQEEQARTIAQRLEEYDLLTARKPYTVVGAIVYIVTGINNREATKITFENIGKKLEVAGCSINSAFKDIKPKLEILLAGILDKTQISVKFGDLSSKSSITPLMCLYIKSNIAYIFDQKAVNSI